MTDEDTKTIHNFHYNYNMSSGNIGNLSVIIFCILQTITYLINGIFKLNLDPFQLNFPLIVMFVMFLFGLYIQGWSTSITPKE